MATAKVTTSTYYVLYCHMSSGTVVKLLPCRDYTVEYRKDGTITSIELTDCADWRHEGPYAPVQFVRVSEIYAIEVKKIEKLDNA